MNNLKKFAIVSIFCLVAGGLQAATKEWLHINVHDTKGEEEKVRINIPISLIEVMLPLVEEKAVRDGKIRMNDKDFKVSDLRKIWNSVKDEGDSEFVTVDKKDQHVRVYTQGHFLMVQSDENSRKKVSMKLPMAVVDAMLSGNGDELNLMAGVKALKDSGVHDLITVNDDDSNVMVWIDDKNVPLEKE